MSVDSLATRTSTSARAGDHRWLILAVVSIAQLMVVLDATVVNIALPSAQAALRFGNGERQWVVTAYALAFGSLLLLGGRVSDLLGRKATIIGGLAVFAVASALGGAAPSFAVLVTARAVQGMAGAMLAPAALSTLVTTFKGPRDRARAFGVFATVAVAGGAVGLILGGVLTQYLSWRWVMYVNVIFAAVAAAGAVTYMRHDRPAARHRIDIAGSLLSAAGLFGLVFGLAHAETAGWGSAVTVVSLALGVALLAGFVRAEQRVSAPLLPLRVLTDRTRAVAFTAVAVVGVGMFGVFLFLTYYLQQVKGFSPVTSGLAFLPMIACAMISSNTANLVTLPRFGPRIVITSGMALGSGSMLCLTQITVHSGYASHVLPALMLMGLGMGMVMAPSINTATAGVSPQDAGVASAFVNTMQQIGGSIGTAVLSTVTATVTARYLSQHPRGALAVSTAATHGYEAAFTIGACLFAAATVMCGLLFPPKAQIDERRAASAAPSPQ